MKLLDTPSPQLIERLNRRGLGGYLRVALATPWANMEEALAQVDADEMWAEAVRAFLDLPKGGISEIVPYTDAVLTEYFGEYLPTAKSFLISSGRSEAFKEYATFCALRAVDATAVNTVGCHEGSWQSDYRWMGESRPGLGRDHVNRPDSGGYGQS
jgi:hypothetical protein